MKEQRYSNHIRFVPSWHFVTFPAIGAALVIAIMEFSKALGNHTPIAVPLMFLLITFSLLSIALHARLFALKAQDRAIRSEENFRHFVLTGKPLDARLKMGQIIALRFASDEELAELAQRAANEQLTPKTIKQSVKNWRADHHRA